ncbi:hypothetical protein SPBR_07556 [Sporothrix brasiliensis 5110]|uniref:Uncharacterized protein n=1 Tax=Sporothrix brasiliensis 5110 TaxID=1398154 RepID=A0A0C2IW50_9PEZI|nr:uncharacterized protein SPBR_07556 [Sporothrix brasiliensis 5110]KIH89192.1 hypothetical protein SPBR_07556 [Sporothrix brasiliensis 5110]
MKPASLITTLAFAAFGSTLAQNSTSDASTGDVGKQNGNGGEHHGGDRSGGGGEHGHQGHSKHHKGLKGVNAGSTLERCTILQRFNHIIDSAANATQLQIDFKGNATRIARVQAEATQLRNATSPQGALFVTLRSNATFLGICDTIFATESSGEQCNRLRFLEARATLAANATALDKAAHGNTTRAQHIQAAVTKAQPELAALQGNETLLQFCAMFQTQAQCRLIKQLYGDVSLARNATRLNQTLEGNTTRIAAFQNLVAKATAQLDKLLNNATLVSVCKTEMPFILDLANELPNATVTSVNAVSQSTASRNVAVSALLLVVFFMLSFNLL